MIKLYHLCYISVIQTKGYSHEHVLRGFQSIAMLWVLEHITVEQDLDTEVLEQLITCGVDGCFDRLHVG